MEKSTLYTRTGDTGTTSLCGGERIPKDSTRLEAYGTVDELSAHLGAIAAHPQCPQEQRRHIQAIQNRLFHLGAYLASQPGSAAYAAPHSLTPQIIAGLESLIDSADSLTPKIRAFILPGGCQAAAQAHIARTVCRRAERSIIALSRTEHVDPIVITYFNRLSDYLFILARLLNHLSGTPEVVWQKT